MALTKSIRDALSRNVVEPVRRSRSRSRSRTRSFSRPRSLSHTHEKSSPSTLPPVPPTEPLTLPTSPTSDQISIDSSADDSDSESESTGIEVDEAESFIGGSAVAHPDSPDRASPPFSAHSVDSSQASDAEHMSRSRSEAATTSSSVNSSHRSSSKHRKSASVTSTAGNEPHAKKVFPFSLPFAVSYGPPSLPKFKEIREFTFSSLSNSSAATSSTASDSSSSAGVLSRSSHSLRKKARTLPIFREKDKENHNHHDDNTLHERPALTRTSTEESVADSIIEDSRNFANIHQMDNSRLRAVKETIRTSISMDQFFFSTPKDGIPEDLTGDVVILGGYRGSILRDAKTHRRTWIPLKVGLNIRKINLELGLSDEAELNAEDDIIPDGMLSHIGPVDISRRLIRKMQLTILKANPGCTVHEFGYDWRLSNDLLSQKLDAFLRDIKSRRGPHWNGAIVIAHSMGGIVAHAAMLREPSLFRGLVYVGSPFSCVNILGPIRHGDSVMLSTKVLNAQVNFSMRSSFVFLPLDGRCFVDKNTGQEIRLDFFDLDTWIEYGLSPCVRTAGSPHRRISTSSHDPESPTHRKQHPDHPRHSLEHTASPTSEASDIVFADAVAYLERILSRTKQFKESLEADDPTANYPPLAVVYGDTVPTVRGARVAGERGIKDGDFSDYIFTPGDGVVPARHLMPPRGFDVVAKIESDRGHVGLLGDIPAMGKALRAILDEERRRMVEGPPTVAQRIEARKQAVAKADEEQREEDTEMSLAEGNLKSTAEEVGAGVAGLSIEQGL
ncbi:hypothetical protein BZA70DRAFT_310042 [Myxozyma melibiosi]|uniref:AB hydrolase-1 domain-containing protein n=1 Tax=Myxozyma melibiosi TaxID=54550 RepID=A0ABR1F923_9ASCO